MFFLVTNILVGNNLTIIFVFLYSILNGHFVSAFQAKNLEVSWLHFYIFLPTEKKVVVETEAATPVLIFLTVVTKTGHQGREQGPVEGVGGEGGGAHGHQLTCQE